MLFELRGSTARFLLDSRPFERFQWGTYDRPDRKRTAPPSAWTQAVHGGPCGYPPRRAARSSGAASGEGLQDRVPPRESTAERLGRGVSTRPPRVGIRRRPE